MTMQEYGQEQRLQMTDIATFPEPVLAPSVPAAPSFSMSLDTGPSLAEMSEAIAGIAGGLDARFVAAGTALARAYDIVEGLVGALESVTNAFERDAADAAVGNMRGTADRLMQLPAIQAARKEALVSIERAGTALSHQIDQVNRTLSFLRICGLNIKVAAAGSGDFSGFADSMFVKLDLGETEMEGLSREIAWLAEAVPAMFEVERQLAGECALVIPHIPRKLSDDAVALQRHQIDLAERALRIAEVARHIRAQVGTALGALQVGDSTRQRLEHLADGLIDIDAFIAAPGELPADVAALIADHAVALISAQAVDTLETFQRESRLLASSLRGIGPSAASLLELREGGDSEEGSGDGVFLHRLERSVADVASVTERLREADARSNRLSGHASKTAENLAQRLATVHRITSDVQQMAWNTDLRCYRMGAEGRGLAVVASEIRGFAATLATIASGIAQSFDGLTAAAAVIRGSEDGAPEDVGAALTVSLDCIRDGGDRMRSGLSALDEGAVSVTAILEETTGAIDCEEDVGGPLMAIAERLSGLGREAAEIPEAGEAAFGTLLGSIAARYTMAREREVHRAFQPGAEAAPSADPFDLDDDDFDDGLF
ncbi:hypothetical protein [Novosphingobium sp. ZW T3_23]|uniref:hypothetical protein n=1 Tax=Novosphingobium sp. ZW T3_23 TaxID=3378084 RepID=UPI003851C946